MRHLYAAGRGEAAGVAFGQVALRTWISGYGSSEDSRSERRLPGASEPLLICNGRALDQQQTAASKSREPI